MTLDHLNTTPMPPDQPPEDGLPMDSPPETSGEPPKKKRPWLLPAILAAATAALVIGAAGETPCRTLTRPPVRRWTASGPCPILSPWVCWAKVR